MSPPQPPRSLFSPREGPKDASSPLPGGLEPPSTSSTPPCPLPASPSDGLAPALVARGAVLDDELQAAVDAAWEVSGREAVWALVLEAAAGRSEAPLVYCPGGVHRGDPSLHFCGVCGLDRWGSGAGPTVVLNAQRCGEMRASAERDAWEREHRPRPLR
jgi:hypothetical protein